MVLGAFLIDVVPRSLWRSRARLRSVWQEARRITREHWTRERITLVVLGLTCFYVTYVSYRNLKNYLPRLYDTMEDPKLHALDQWLFFGHEPATVLHSVFGETWAAQGLAFIYLLYLPLAPISLVVWLVWSRNISYGYWYATANCLTWTLGTISYYAIPTMGPNFWYPWLYRDLDVTGVSALQDSLWNGRQEVRFPLNPFSDSLQSVAGFASLHVALTLVIALVAHYTVRHALLRWARVGLLRPHRALDAVLRLALRRRRHRRRPHRGHRRVAGRHRDRAAFRPARAGRPTPPRAPRTSPSTTTSSSRPPRGVDAAHSVGCIGQLGRKRRSPDLFAFAWIAVCSGQRGSGGIPNEQGDRYPAGAD